MRKKVREQIEKLEQERTKLKFYEKSYASAIDWYFHLCDKLMNEIDEVVKLKETIRPFSETRTLTIEYVPSQSQDVTLELIAKLINAEFGKKQVKLFDSTFKNNIEE